MPEQNKVKILVVDDSITIRRTIVKHLGSEYETLEAADGEEAWKLLKSDEAISLVFADMHMPVMNGMLLLKKVRSSQCERIASMPVIIITGYENADAAKRASHNIGATDFISKPFDSFDILSKASSYIGLDNKITSRIQQNDYDKLTGLLSEASFVKHGERALEYAESGGMDTSVLCMQIVGLSDVFKAHGETTTKQIIIAIANHLDDALRGNEKVAHIGSGKFTVILPVTNEFKANIVAIRLQKLVTKLAFEKGKVAIRIRMAVGISSTDSFDDQLSFESLRVQAENALQLSLEQPTAPIVRFDETYEKRCIEEGREKTVATEQSVAVKRSITDDSEVSKYFASIMAGDFDKVPAYYLEAMVGPLQKFLEYAYTYTEVEMKKPTGVAERKAL